VTAVQASQPQKAVCRTDARKILPALVSAQTKKSEPFRLPLFRSRRLAFAGRQPVQPDERSGFFWNCLAKFERRFRIVGSIAAAHPASLPAE
jgi:hypothetical protein